jgi:predicted lysophospholipase L1 biosynthesis ABC-type transport system permease subunit
VLRVPGGGPIADRLRDDPVAAAGDYCNRVSKGWSGSVVGGYIERAARPLPVGEITVASRRSALGLAWREAGEHRHGRRRDSAPGARLARSSADGYTRAALLMAIAVVLAGGLSLAVTTADGIGERHRAHSALTAMGTPARVLRRGALLYTALPLVLTIGLAVLVTAASSWLLVRLSASTGIAPPPLPWNGYAAIGATTLVACLLATAATLPFIRAVTRPDALRIE